MQALHAVGRFVGLQRGMHSAVWNDGGVEKVRTVHAMEGKGKVYNPLMTLCCEISTADIAWNENYCSCACRDFTHDGIEVGGLV